MPHYADGTPAEVGDLVRGKTYNYATEVVGTVIHISPGTEQCNCQVAFCDVRPAESLLAAYGGPIGAFVSSVSTGEGVKQVAVVPRVDYGETKAFSLVSRAEKP